MNLNTTICFVIFVAIAVFEQKSRMQSTKCRSLE